MSSDCRVLLTFPGVSKKAVVWLQKHTFGGGRSKPVSSSRSFTLDIEFKPTLLGCLNMGLGAELPQAPVGRRCSNEGGIDAEGEVKGGKSVDWRDNGGA